MQRTEDNEAANKSWRKSLYLSLPVTLPGGIISIGGKAYSSKICIQSTGIEVAYKIFLIELESSPSEKWILKIPGDLTKVLE